MFHPDAILKIAHDREAELVRDAQACGVPQVEGRAARLTRPMLIATALAVLATAFWLFIG